MSEQSTSEVIQMRVAETMTAVLDMADRLFDTARPDAVYGEPTTVAGRTIIPAAEVWLFSGFGGGGGFGPAAEGAEGTGETGAGLGSGVGGAVHARPVAVVIVDESGVRVEPVVDATKLGLAALTVFGSMVFFLGRIMRRTREFDRGS